MSTETDDFAQVLGPLLRPGYLLAVAMLGDQGQAEDAVQEAAIKAWRKLPTLRDRAAVQTWFLSIVANQCRSVRRLRWWSVLRQPSPLVREIAKEDRTDESIDLDRALDRLPKLDRLALYLHFYRDMTYEEVGAVMGVGMAGARSRIHRATKRLRPELDQQEVFGHE
jgi:RNA polymerase sigma-70 factor (ECF subfamily)